GRAGRGVSGVGRVRDAARGRGARLARSRARDVGDRARHPPRGRRPRDHLFRARDRRAPERGTRRGESRAMSPERPAEGGLVTDRAARASEPPATGAGAGADAALGTRAARVTPGGVHSPVRAFRAVGVPPLALVEARGARVRDAEGREYVDWIGAWGPALLGHAHPRVVEAVRRAAQSGLLFGLVSPAEVELAERVTARVPGMEMVRFVATGTEAAMSAVRIARAATGRPGMIKFSGCYHGHADP